MTTLQWEDGRMSSAQRPDAAVQTDPAAPVLPPVTVGDRPRGVAVTPDGRRVYVACDAGVATAREATRGEPASTTVTTAGADPVGVARGR